MGLLYRITYTGLEPTLTLRLADLYGFGSTKVGLVILASGVAAIFGMNYYKISYYIYIDLTFFFF